MAEKQKVEVTNSIGVVGALGIVFVILKLTGHIQWSWWWVTVPFWGPFALAFTILIIATPFILWHHKRKYKA